MRRWGETLIDFPAYKTYRIVRFLREIWKILRNRCGITPGTPTELRLRRCAYRGTRARVDPRVKDLLMRFHNGVGSVADDKVFVAQNFEVAHRFLVQENGATQYHGLGILRVAGKINPCGRRQGYRIFTVL